uniref:Uncharacterized protein n=1 Tax=Rhizophora mucronata TaxID=61149 RepID=A0A2P2IT34_RHIMU
MEELVVFRLQTQTGMPEKGCELWHVMQWWTKRFDIRTNIINTINVPVNPINKPSSPIPNLSFLIINHRNRNSKLIRH